MTQLAEKAFVEVTKLPEEAQDRMAAWFLEEIAHEARWDKAFDESADKLALLAEEALAEDREGKTQVLDPEVL